MSDTSSGHHLAPDQHEQGPDHHDQDRGPGPWREPARRATSGGSVARGEAELLLLTTGAPNEVLARIADGDPLGLAARLVRRAAARALLVDPAQLFARGAAHCARRARDYRGRPRPSLWLERRAEEVVRSIERGAGRAMTELAGAPGMVPASAGHEPKRLESRTGTWGAELERAAARFNTCARGDREALWRLAFAGSTLDEQARERGCSLSDVARRARRALDALLAGRTVGGPGEPMRSAGRAANGRAKGEVRS